MKDKIRKLLILANDKGATEGEKDSALQLAQDLMMKYNLQVDLTDEEVRIRKGEVFGKSYTLPWHKLLATSVAYMYVCRIVWIGNPSDNFGFMYVGRPESISAAQMTLDSLIDQINILWKDHLKTSDYAQEMNRESKEYRYSFRWGAAARVWGRIQEMRQAVENVKDNKRAMEATGCTALVVKKKNEQIDADIQDFMDNKMDLKDCKAIAVRKHGSGHGAGRAAGDLVRINQGISDGVVPLQIEQKKG